jgi:surface protein
MFYSASNFNQSLNAWDVGMVTDMTYMFGYASSFNRELNAWDVGRVTVMEYMFGYASSFNQTLNGWDVSKMTDMSNLFFYASSFNQELNAWDVGRVTVMEYMFGYASSFNQTLNAWNVSRVTNMYGMFFLASSFNQNLCPWGDIPTFPYWYVDSMFYGSGCTYPGDPIRTNKGPFCASDCIACEISEPESFLKSKPFFESIPSSSQSPSSRYATCGSGNVGNWLCPDPNACCSDWGWCGYGVDYCGYWDNDNLYSNSNKSQNEKFASETTFLSVSVSEQVTAIHALTGASTSSTSSTSSSSTAKDRPPKHICYYPGNKKCPKVPQKSTARSCSCK